MKLIKKADRNIKVSDMARALRTTETGRVITVGTWCKWKELKTQGGRIQVSMTIYRVEMANGTVTYFMGDSLDRICTSMDKSLRELREWLSEHDYITEKNWHLENGMTEETWNEWNGTEA